MGELAQYLAAMHQSEALLRLMWSDSIVFHHRQDLRRCHFLGSMSVALPVAAWCSSCSFLLVHVGGVPVVGLLCIYVRLLLFLACATVIYKCEMDMNIGLNVRRNTRWNGMDAMNTHYRTPEICIRTRTHMHAYNLHILMYSLWIYQLSILSLIH